MPRHEALLRQANALLEIARTKQGAEADTLYRSACDTYTKSLQLHPGRGEALVGLGCAWLALAGRSADPEARQALLARARKALFSAEALAVPAAAYNLACLCTLEGDLAGARRWLGRAKKRHQLPHSEQLLGDPDLAALRGEAWFVNLARRD